MEKKKDTKKILTKEESIYKKFPEPKLNNNTWKYLDQLPPEISKEKKIPQPVHVYPNEVIFQDIEPNKGEEMIVMVKNATKNMMRIKIKQPITNKFFCDYRNTGPLAPGMAMELIVSFKTSEEGTNFSDEILITPEGESPIKLPLIAFTKTWHIVYPPFVNYGFIDPEKPVSKEIVFRNEGDNTAEVILTPSGPDAGISVAESSFEVHPRSESKVQVTMKGATSGELKNGYLNVTVGGETREPIMLYAVVVKQVLSVVFENGAGQGSEINFGSLFFGETRECNAVLVNNGPKNISFNITFSKEGAKEGSESYESHAVQAPRDMGIEMMEREMSASPLSDTIAGYSELPIKFLCRTKKSPKFHILEYNDKKDDEHKNLDPNYDKISVDYHFTAHLSYEDKEEIRVEMKAHACLPMISLRTALSFGECEVNERRDTYLQIKNHTDDLAVPFEFQKVAHFHITPSRDKLHPMVERSIPVSFQPKNLGVFSTTVLLKLAGGIYSVPIKLYGIARKIGSKQKALRGPEATIKDFEEDKHFVDESQAKRLRKAKNANSSIPADLKESTTMQIAESFQRKELSAKKEQKKTQEDFGRSKIFYNEYLTQERKQREYKELKLKKRKLMSKNKPLTLEQYLNDIDLNMEEGRPSSPKIFLALPNDPLWVVKSVGKHEPSAIESKRQVEFGSNYQMRKVPFDPMPKGQEQSNNCSAELSGSQLQKINAGPVEIDFGKLFVNSEEIRYFNVYNELAEFIQVQFTPIQYVTIIPESQVIPGKNVASFTLKFKSKEPINRECFLQYKINNKHVFKIRLRFQVEAVELRISPADVMNFPMTFDNEDRSMEKYLIISNPGNWPATYDLNLVQSHGNAFKVATGKDIVIQKREEKQIKVVYTPTEEQLSEDAKIIINILYGKPVEIPCRGTCPKGECEIVGSQEMDFGEVQVGNIGTEEKIIKIKNKQTREQAIVHYDSSSIPELNIKSPNPLKIHGNNEATISATLFSKEQKEIKGQLRLYVRGGKTLTVDVKGNIIVPNISIEEEEFDFGMITAQGVKVKPITFVNTSSIPAKVNVNFDTERELDIMLPQGQAEEGGAFRRIQEEKKEPVNEMLDNSDSEEESEKEIDESELSKNYEITIPANGKFVLSLKFTPDITLEGKREIELPIEIVGAGKLTEPRKVKMEIVKPKMSLEPQHLDFEDKVVTGKPYHSSKELTIFNMQTVSSLSWQIKQKEVEDDGIWQVNPYEGIVESGGTMTIHVMFNPQHPGEYAKKLLFYVEGNLDVPYLEIEMKGRGTTPKLGYDKNEILIPPAPLNMESKAWFSVQNLGYDNLDLSIYKIRFVDYPPQEIPVRLAVPDKRNVLNVSNLKVKIEAIFQSAKPINMTGKIDFTGDTTHPPSPIDVSAVADNCLLTNYSYIQRYYEDVTYNIDDAGRITLTSNECNDSDDDVSPSGGPKVKQSGRAISKAGSTVSRTSRRELTMLGYNPVSIELRKKACDYIKRWLNSNALVSNINYFPGDLIKEHGRQIIELIQFLSGINMNAKFKAQNSKKDAEPEKTYIDFYEFVLTELTKYGAMLNTIRLDHLLSEEEYKRQHPQIKVTGSDINTRYTYLSEEAWMTLFYQIIKIFYLRRVNAAHFKSLMMNLPGTEKLLPPPGSSNVYSDSEVILLKWLEYHYNQQNPLQQKTLRNFESDLQDSLVFVAVIKAYCKNVKSLNAMRITTKTPEDLLSNAQKLIYALKTELQLRTHITERDIIEPSGRDMVIFCTQLYLYLPYYSPIDTIDFPCTLHDTVTKTIELKNDNNVRISYSAQLEGSTDFSIGDKKFVSIEPGKVENFPVTFSSRISRQVEAVLMFINQGDGPRQAAPLVFKLRSDVSKRVSTEVYSQNTDINLYEEKEIQIEVANKFARNARFSIQLRYEKRKPVETAQKPRGKPKEKKVVDNTSEILKYIPEPFFCKQDSIAVNKGQSQLLSVFFRPFELGQHRCFVILVDNDVSELQYEIIANALLPLPQAEPIIKTFSTESKEMIEIPIPSRNVKMEGARGLLVAQCHKDRKEKERINWENYKRLVQEQQQFEVKITDSSGVFKAPTNIVVSSQRTGKDLMSSKLDASRIPSEMMSDKGEENKLQIEFLAKIVKKYETKIMILNSSKTDVRIFDLVIKTHPPPVFGNLTFNVPARQLVVQDIPINNESDRDWNIKVELQFDRGQPGRFEIGRGEYVAPKKQVTNIQLRFIPEWVCEIKGNLNISILTTNQTFKYELLGKGEEPLAEDKISVKCEAKKTTKHTLTIRNDTDRVVNYNIETDLFKVLSGNLSLKILPRETANYVLNITPLVGGIDMGSITFIESDGRYIWYVVEVNVSSPEAEEEKPMETYVRRPIAYEFSIKNPLNEPVTFDVDIKGEGLIGEASLGVPANQTKTYELIYAPLKAGEGQGYINFVSEKAGEIKYKLALKAEESPAVALEFMEVELGKHQIKYVTLENPTREEQIVISSNTNKTNYEVQDKLIIPPYSAMEVPIKYTPSNLDTIESVEITFSSNNIGKWKFTLDGRGQLPTEMPPERVSTTIGESHSGQIIFKNPLKEQATIEISLEPEDVKEFKIVVKKTKQVLNPLSSFTIPFQFTPESMTVVKATIVVSMSKTLVWRFPLEGDAEYIAHQTSHFFRCKSRKRSQETVKIKLEKLVGLKPEDTFSIEVAPKESSLAGVIDRSVVAELVRPTIANLDDPLEVVVKFEPLRPFKAPSELIVCKSSGGRWKFPCVFEAAEPEVDDVIEIKSPLHKTSSVSFKLCNHTRAYADFQAFFTHDSATEFSVYPKSGVLEPFGKDGTNFIVSFTPTEYGKNKTGKLVIQTEEMQWTYEIRGSHPEYKVPKPKGVLIDNKLPKEIESKILRKGSPQTKNFVRDNIRKPKDMEKKVKEEIKKKEASPGKSRTEFNISRYSVNHQPSQGLSQVQ